MISIPSSKPKKPAPDFKLRETRQLLRQGSVINIIGSQQKSKARFDQKTTLIYYGSSEKITFKNNKIFKNSINETNNSETDVNSVTICTFILNKIVSSVIPFNVTNFSPTFTTNKNIFIHSTSLITDSFNMIAPTPTNSPTQNISNSMEKGEPMPQKEENGNSANTDKSKDLEANKTCTCNCSCKNKKGRWKLFHRSNISESMFFGPTFDEIILHLISYIREVLEKLYIIAPNEKVKENEPTEKSGANNPTRGTNSNNLDVVKWLHDEYINLAKDVADTNAVLEHNCPCTKDSCPVVLQSRRFVLDRLAELLEKKQELENAYRKN